MMARFGGWCIPKVVISRAMPEIQSQLVPYYATALGRSSITCLFFSYISHLKSNCTFSRGKVGKMGKVGEMGKMREMGEMGKMRL
jgi:hypothetical protein